ncbi:U-box domain-containing protein 8-like [Aristolochia californica]|uniref:U-box domain-containing protein 8-like n=1 Tax=Aristolochia californica TaxID=171875 RepID=UPI0035DFE4C4
MGTELPDDFKCPISLEIMSDPVILSSGHTFDRASIQRWLDSGNRTCPITKLPLPAQPSLIPNHALRSLISNYTLSSSPPRSQPCSSPQILLAQLTSPSSTTVARLDSLRTLHRLSKHSPTFRHQITDSGAVSVILRFVGSADTTLQEAALSLLFDLSLDDDNKVGLVAEGAISGVVAALRTGTDSCRALAATTLTSLAVVEVNKGTIGDHPFAIAALVELLKDGKGRGQREAATAIYTLCSFPENQRRVVRSGGVPILVQLAGSGVERAVEVLGLLGKCKEGRQEMENFNGFAQTLVGILKGGSSRSVSHALATLGLVCANSKRICLEVVKEGVWEVSFGLVKDENVKIRRNATTLIHVLKPYR